MIYETDFGVEKIISDGIEKIISDVHLIIGLCLKKRVHRGLEVLPQIFGRIFSKFTGPLMPCV